MKIAGVSRQGRRAQFLVALLFLSAVLCSPVAVISAQTKAPPPSTQHPQAQPPDHKISPQEAAELFRSVDEILAFASKDTGLPLKQPVQRKLAGRDEVERYIEQRMNEDEDTRRLERSEATLKKLGLLPRDFALRPYLLGLLKEQVAGFYDPKTKTVYLLDWVDADSQKPVLAHELTHALQDQSFDLEQWTKVSPPARSDQDDVARDEAQSARDAVVEGQAMVVLLDYMLAPIGRSIADSPNIVDTMKSAMVENRQSPMFAKAPLFLRQALIFPYLYGLEFERQVLAKRGRAAAFQGVFEKPPADTRQIMQPSTYLSGQLAPRLAIPKLDTLLKGEYTRYDFGGLGEFDIEILVWQWLGRQAAEQMGASWRGGYYFTFAGTKQPGAPYSLVCVTRWANQGDADEFAKSYAGSLVTRYKKTSEKKPFQNGSGEWNTDQGAVDISVSGNYVIAIEGLAPGERNLVRQAIEESFHEESRAAPPK